MHADEDGDQVQHKKAEIMSNSIQNTMVINHLHVEEGKDEVKLNPERHDDHLQGGKGEV